MKVMVKAKLIEGVQTKQGKNGSMYYYLTILQNDKVARVFLKEPELYRELKVYEDYEFELRVTAGKNGLVFNG